MRDVCFGTVLMMLICAGVGAEAAQPAQTTGADYLVPFPAHHVIGNIYFVGSKGLGIYLVSTPQGHILINAGLEESVPMIQQSVEKVGLRFSDIKILLISHAHFDHDAGAARIKKLTGAKYMVMDSDVPVVESGGGKDFFYARTPGMLYPAAKVDRVLHDGDTVSLGDSVLTAHLTPGHTKACTTWTLSRVAFRGVLPVNTQGGLFEVGDGHAAQNDGETGGTALETSLRGRLQFIVRKDMYLRQPRAETPTEFITMGADADLTAAAKSAVQDMTDFLMEKASLSRSDANRVAGMAADLHVSEVADEKVGAYMTLPKSVLVR